MRMKEGKLVLIGAGMVGSATLNAILAQSVVSEIVVIDANEDKALGEVLDALHTTSFAYSTNTTIRVGSYADCADASIIVMTAGPSIQAGDNDRRVLAEKNIAVMDAVMAEITRYTRSAILIVVTNPVDLVTYFAQIKYNYPADKIFGTGTLLDTARMRQLIAAQCNVDSKNVHGYLLGEHGESAFIPWSMVNVAGIPVDELPRAFGLSAALDKEKILADTKAAGLRVLKLKGFTSSGIAQSVARLVRAIVLVRPGAGGHERTLCDRCKRPRAGAGSDPAAGRAGSAGCLLREPAENAAAAGPVISASKTTKRGCCKIA